LGDIDDVDAIVIQAFHREYRDLPGAFFQRARVVLDGRGELDPTALGLRTTSYIRIGSPSRDGDWQEDPRELAIGHLAG
jgi:hypothetical protein